MTSQSGFEAQSNAAEAPCVLDRSKLDQLQKLIGSEKTAVALQKFRQDFEANMSAIGQDATPTEEKGMRAHKLVGTAGALGLDELCQKSRRFEEAVKQNVGNLQPYLEQLMSAAERARKELSGLM